MFRYGKFYIPDRMMPGLRNWLDHGIVPGQFLCAVLQNDLREAVLRADDENIQNLPAYIAYLYETAPSQCWGSIEKFKGWIEMHDKYRAERHNREKLEMMKRALKPAPKENGPTEGES